ncbi:pickpocket protein 28-like [Zophobas morio]|uniref:pickpocket protein 28-like n=1 Tax=Zophobas morio TaxID=2755281 RepID=UPI0030834826
MFSLCIYQSENNCEELFTPVITDTGLCYSFNILGREDISYDHVYNYAQYYRVPHKIAKHFNWRSGYEEKIGVDAYPRRAIMAGYDHGLLVYLKFNEQIKNPTCTDFLRGFQVLIHSPWEAPLLQKHSIVLTTNKTAVVGVEAELVQTSVDLIKYKPNKRKCYLYYEGSLKHFKIYTQSNCVLECRTDHVLKQCGCVEYFMPKFLTTGNNTTAICGNSLLECALNAENDFIEVQKESKIKGYDYCDCKPACSSLKFSAEISQANYDEEKLLRRQGLTDMEAKGTAWTLLHIYFKEEYVTALDRNELHGISDLISNFGGVLGLFT